MQGSLLPSFNIIDPVVSEKMSFEVIVHKFVKFTTSMTPGAGPNIYGGDSFEET